MQYYSSAQTFNKCCRNKIYECPLKCGTDQEKFTDTEVRDHLESKCPLMKVKCSTCDEESIRKELKTISHSAKLCNLNLQKKFLRNKEEVE